METRIAAISMNDLFSPKKSIMHIVTITGYMKLIVEAIPLEMLAYPMRSVMEVMDLRILSIAIFHPSLNELMRRLFFLKNA